MACFSFEGKEYVAEDGETVLGALLRHGVQVPFGCKTGACQACLMKCEGTPPPRSQTGVDEVLASRGAFLACQAKSFAGGVFRILSEDDIPRHRAVLMETTRLADDVLLADFVVENWTACPGRFIRLRHPSGVERPYSVATPASCPGDLVQLHVRLVPGGAMSSLLASAQPGEQYSLTGPFGKCCYRPGRPEEPLVMIGSGTGLAPLYAIATDALSSGHIGPITLYQGASDSERHYFRSELALLASRFPQLEIVFCADQEVAPGDREGSPLAAALADHPKMEGYRAYLCGHPALVKAAQRSLFLAGVDMQNIHADPFEAVN